MIYGGKMKLNGFVHGKGVSPRIGKRWFTKTMPEKNTSQTLKPTKVG